MPLRTLQEWVNAGCATEEGVVTLLGITCIVRNIIYQLQYIIALAALGMIIFAGIKYISAGADPKSIQSAQQTLIWAIVGIIMLPVAWLLLVMIERFTGAQVTQFGSPL